MFKQEKLYGVREITQLLNRLDKLGWSYEFLNEDESFIGSGDIYIEFPNGDSVIFVEVCINCWEKKYNFA